MPVLDEYVVWYGKIVKSYFEGELYRGNPPAVFEEWLSGADLSRDTELRARQVHEMMAVAGKAFLVKYGSRDNPPLAEYKEFARRYEEFIQFMHRLELDHATENSGYDDKTGLRASKLIPGDIAREMERRARRGNPFTLALVKMNNFKPEWRNSPEIQSVILKVAEQLKECLRSFDDAYYMGDEFYLLSLKHADLIGAQAALGRLNGLIGQAHIKAPDGSGEEVSVSSVLCEPVPGDDLNDLLRNMKTDLNGVESRGTVLQYTDLSPVQRYINSIERRK